MLRNLFSKPKIAVCQLTCKEDRLANFQKCVAMVKHAKQHGCKMIFFPECSDFVGRNRQEACSLAENHVGETLKSFTELAKEEQMWISIGGYHNKKNEKLAYNTHLVIDEKGNVVCEYDKLHQFNIDIPGKVRLLEREFSTAGDQLIPPISTPIGKVALNICYDLRFPELSIYHRKQGADVLTFPAAFTVPTGMAHWEVLLRARAIENQCYVVAAAQFGAHNETRSSYGHAMVVDPYGKVVSQCSDMEGVIFADIDLDYVQEVRRGLNVIGDRRDDLYSIYYHQKLNATELDMDFANHKISADCIFYRSALSFAFVNLKPFVPGHVLVCPNRVAPLYKDLSHAEVADLMNTVKVVSTFIAEKYGTISSTISIQNGSDAGQSVPHVHVHVLPRHKGDFDGDQFYSEFAKHEDKRVARSRKEMAAESAEYRKLI